MAEFIYQMIKARKAYGDRVILDDVTLSFLPGAKIGVVGPNGMGKSTLLKIMAGLDTVSNGEASLTPGYTVGILQQEPPLDDTKTVGENIKMAFGPIAEKVARFNAIGEEMANPDADFDALMDEMGKLQTEIDAADGWDLDSQLEQAMDALQCPDPDTPVNVCSGGERRRVALCKLLLEAPDLLLLDEPTNHLDAESILWLEQFLHQYKGAVIAVTHDRYFMDNVAEWICEVDRGHLYPYKGNYSTYLETKAKRLEIQGAKDAKLAKRLKNELDCRHLAAVAVAGVKPHGDKALHRRLHQQGLQVQGKGLDGPLAGPLRQVAAGLPLQRGIDEPVIGVLAGALHKLHGRRAGLDHRPAQGGESCLPVQQHGDGEEALLFAPVDGQDLMSRQLGEELFKVVVQSVDGVLLPGVATSSAGAGAFG